MLALAQPALGELLTFFNGRLFLEAKVNGAPTPARVHLGPAHHPGLESVPTVANGTRLQADFDLGNGSAVLISRAAATRLHLRIMGRSAGGGIQGRVRRDLVTQSSLEVAGRSFRNVVAAVDDQPDTQELNIGTSILKHFLITTDFQQRAAWLVPERR